MHLLVHLFTDTLTFISYMLTFVSAFTVCVSTFANTQYVEPCRTNKNKCHNKCKQMPQQMQRNATTNAKRCHNKCKEMPQQMQRNATINAQKCHNKCKEMPQQMQRNATRNATTNANKCRASNASNICRSKRCNICISFFGGPDPSRVVLSDQVKI